MRVILDTRCVSCNNIDEQFGRRDEAFRCSICQSESKPIISPVKCKLEGVTGDFPGAAMKWEREHIRNGGSSQ